MELKEIYIAPEVELLLFRPVETLADDSFWSTYGIGTGGVAGDTTLESTEINDENGEEP